MAPTELVLKYSVGDVPPVDSGVCRLPDASRHRSEVEGGRLGRVPCDSHHPPAPERSDAAPPHHPAQVVCLYSWLRRSRLVMSVHDCTSAIWLRQCRQLLSSTEQAFFREGEKGIRPRDE